MNDLNIYSPDMDLSDDMKEVIDEKFSNKLKDHFDSINIEKVGRLSINFDDRRNEYELGFDQHLPHGEEMYVSSKSQNFVSAVVDVREKALRYIKKYKDK